MTAHLLDSDAVIDTLGGIEPTLALLQRLRDQGNTLCTCDIVITEVFSGLSPAEQRAARHLLDSLEFLEATRVEAELAGEWRYRYRRQGVQISTTDALIAATAFVHQAHVVTANLRDYPMPEITVVPVPREKRQ